LAPKRKDEGGDGDSSFNMNDEDRMDEEADYNENRSDDFDDYSSDENNRNQHHHSHHNSHHQMASSPNSNLTAATTTATTTTKLIQMNPILNEAHLNQLHQQQQQQQMMTSNPNNSVLNTSLSNISNGGGSGSGGNQIKKPRLVFTDIQRRTLQAIFKETKRPSKEMQVTIAQQLGLEVATVSNFFMNARRRSMDKWRDQDGGLGGMGVCDDNSNSSLFK
jgi:hypothetical protein